MKVKSLVCILVTSLMFSIIPISVIAVTAKSDIVGNTAGNIANGNLAIQYGEKIYYIDKKDLNNIYSMALDGTRVTKIKNVKCSEISIYNGWIYFIDNITGNICKYNIKVGNVFKFNTGKAN